MECNIEIPEPNKEECNGCYQETKCVISTIDNIFFDIKKNDSLDTVIEKIAVKSKELEDRITNIENSLT